MNEIDPKISRLYREAANEVPPPALDAAILAAARAQAARPAPRKRSAWVRWMAPASALATLVLGVSIALLVQREQVIPEAVERMNQSAPQPQNAPAADSAGSANTRAADRAAPAVPAKKEAPAAAAPAPALPAQRSQPGAAAKATAEAFPAERGTLSAEPAPAAAGAAAPQNASSANAARDAASGRMEAGAPAAAAGKLAPMRQGAAPRSAAAWLEDIRRLRQQGRDAEAAEQLAQFRRAYPGYAIPPDLDQ